MKTKPEKLWVTTYVVRLVSEERPKPIELCGVEHLMYGGDDGRSAGGWNELSQELVPFAAAKKVLEDMGEDDCDLLNPEEEGEC